MNITKIINEKINDPHGAKPVTIAFFGDSVTKGCFEVVSNPEKESGFVTKHDSEYVYHAALRQMLQTVFPEVPFNIINAGISGDNATDAIKRFERDVAVYKPDLVVVCFGLNDSRQGMEGLNKYKDSLGIIFEKIKEIGGEALLMTPNMMNTKVSPFIFDEKVKELAIEIMEIQNGGILDAYVNGAVETAKKHNIPVCNCYEKWKELERIGANITELLSNQINHPTREMHKLFAMYLFDAIMFK